MQDAHQVLVLQETYATVGLQQEPQSFTCVCQVAQLLPILADVTSFPSIVLQRFLYPSAFVFAACASKSWQ